MTATARRRAGATAGFVALLVLGAVVVSATTRAPSTRVVSLTARHSRFNPAVVEVPKGTTVRFVVRNLDPIAHELIVGDGAVHDRHEKGSEAHHGGRAGEVSVAAGATAETTFTFDQRGDTLFGCHLPGHWAFGMQGVVRVV